MSCCVRDKRLMFEYGNARMHTYHTKKMPGAQTERPYRWVTGMAWLYVGSFCLDDIFILD